MALIVEDGTGKSDAESYCTTSFVDTYCSNRGLTAWAALTTSAKESALRLATDYIQSKYYYRWDGLRINDTQALDFPRDYVFKANSLNGTIYWANNIVPTDVQTACALLAYKSLSESLMPDAERQTSSETVGNISVTYEKSAPSEKKFLEVDRLLSKFFSSKNTYLHEVVR